ncbi:Hypothetical protein D9617_16g013660 [Elsinoe fawcettii]|nr:Hypothetical protein D9617_16g013660 [Elsinoe fawcettii]
MNYNNQQPPFDWTQFWDVVDNNVRANINPQEGAEARRGRGGRRGGRAAQPDEFADYWANAIRSWGAPFMNMPMHGGPPHRGPHPPPPGRAGPPPPPPGHDGPPPPSPGHEGHPPPPPPGPHGPPPPPPEDGPPSDPPSRSPTPPTPGTPPEDLPEYPGLPHEHPHHSHEKGPRGPHGHRGPPHRHCRRGGKGKGPEDPDDTDRSGGPSHHQHQPPHLHPPHGPFGGGFPFHHHGPGRHGRRGRGGPGGPRGDFNPAEYWKNMFANNGWPFNQPSTHQDNTSDAFTPQYEVFNTTDKVLVYVSLAGAKKENVDVAYDASGHSLTISGVVTRPEEVDEDMFNLRTEGNRDMGYFNVKVDLPSFWGVVEDVKAKMEDGVLRVEVAKPGDEDWEEVRKVRVE